MNPTEFIMRLSPGAMNTAKRSGVPASITVAQAALESKWGESALSRLGNNLFGIKADSRWRGETLSLQTREFIDGKWMYVLAKWRKYTSWQSSIEDHCLFLRNNPRYSECFKCQTAELFAFALSTSGYATDPNYPAKLMALINQYKLNSLDGN